MDIDVFISHSSRDKEVARALVEFLLNACNVPSGRIRCTSLDGFKMEVGTDFHAQLRAEVNGARYFIGLITPDSIRSLFVLFEVGARWGAGMKLAPVLASGADSNHLVGPLSVLNALDSSVEDEMHKLVTDITSFLGYSRANPEFYDHYLRRLVAVSKRKRPQNPT